jgi:osmotically-inducible protein OsmY
METDKKIEYTIQNELEWEPGLDGSRVHPVVHQGIVGLAGVVHTPVERYRAENAALRAPGVRAVADELVVESKIEERQTTRIARAMLTALKACPGLPHHRIKIVVRDGIVRLSGDVDTDFQKAAAIRAVRDLPGVEDVISLLVVRKPLGGNELERRVAEVVRRKVAQ